MTRPRWRNRSRLAQADLVTHRSLHLLTWAGPLAIMACLATGTVRDSPAPLALLLLIGALAVAQGMSGTAVLRGELGRSPGTGPVFPRAGSAALGTGPVVPSAGAAGRRRLVTGGVLLAGTIGWVLSLSWAGGIQHSGIVPVMLAAAGVPFLVPHALPVSARTAATAQLLVATTSGAGLALAGGGPRAGLRAFLVVIAVNGWLACAVRGSARMLRALAELTAAREARARLAAAEERLRLGREMHEALGRRLAVIALNCELAVQLAHQGSPAAVERMAEVQRIAQDSQQEVRDMTCGCREPDARTGLVAYHARRRLADPRQAGCENRHAAARIGRQRGWL
ncbi:histidine kinase dimerization/phosphoacceptor domain-containing protein [Streptomyces palmae]|uniref:histidine kinase dimerization/phosphoacceptor domain-containing protein n=1 Tax=Streptomyces palmae TaxID=1701085 RepID=UPI001432A079|nr:histidine kinase dimerization/phosphoacceptor domain-containing protein [Streptomyces palmae]